MDLGAERVVRKWGVGAALLLSGVASLGMAVSATAASRDFEIRWSSFGTAIARGTMTIDDTVFLNPGDNSLTSISWVTAFSVTITGASAGNGTFTLSDFSDITLDTNGGTLDLSRPLLGQNDGGLFDPVGRNGTGGDFNVFSSGPAPNGTNYGEMSTNGGLGDSLFVTRISPPLPLPLATADRKCQDTIGKLGGKYMAARHGALTRCYSALLAGKAIFEDHDKTVPVTDAADCPNEFKTAAKITKARQALRNGLAKKCTDAILGNLFACAQTVDGLADPTGSSGCLVESIDPQVDHLLLEEYGL
jgi:hypothetical protein